MTAEPAGDEAQAPAGAPARAAPSGAPLDDELRAVKFDHDGLVPAIVQEGSTGRVLMLAWMDAEALRRTLGTGRTWFWSRSRGEYWCKGETSGNRQWVREAWYDCDGDTLLVVVEQEGSGACHTGAATCFHNALACTAAGGPG